MKIKKNEKDEKDEKEEKICHIFMKVNAVDPEEKLEHCYSVALKRPTPSTRDVILNFSPPGIF